MVISKQAFDFSVSSSKALAYDKDNFFDIIKKSEKYSVLHIDALTQNQQQTLLNTATIVLEKGIVTVVDENYYSGDNLFLILGSDNETVFLLPQKTYAELVEGIYISADLQTQKLSKFYDYTYNNTASTRRQIVLYAVWFVMGWLFCTAFIKIKNHIVFAVCAFPVGVCINIIIVLLITMLKIKFNPVSLFCAYGITTAILLYFTVKRRVSIKSIVAAVAVFVPFIYAAYRFIAWGNYFFSGDSVSNWILGKYLSIFGGFSEYITSYVAYGMLSCFGSASAFVLDAGLLYAIYPLLALCGISLVCVLIYTLAKSPTRHFDTTAVALSALGGMLMAYNYEWIFHSVWVLSNLGVSCMLLVLAAFLLLWDNEQNNLAGAILMCCATLLFRTEGAVYVTLFLIVTLFLNKIEKQKKIVLCTGVSIFCIIYNIFLTINYNGQQSMFWSFDKGIISVVCLFTASAFCAVICCLPTVSRFADRYLSTTTLSAVVAICILLVVIGFFGDAANTLKVMVLHIMSNYLFWLPILALLPLLSLSDSDNARFGFFLVTGYLILALITFYARPWAIGNYLEDSARRVILQLMPTAVVVILSGISPVFRYERA